jgi:hypothetical protein
MRCFWQLFPGNGWDLGPARSRPLFMRVTASTVVMNEDRAIQLRNIALAAALRIIGCIAVQLASLKSSGFWLTRSQMRA